MKLKFLLLFIGALVISSKSEPSRIKQQNYNPQSLPQNGSANSFGNYYPKSKRIPSRFRCQEIILTNGHGPVYSNYGSQKSIPNYRSDQGPTSEPRNSGYGYRSSVPSLGPIPRPGNSKYRSQDSFPGYRSNEGTRNGQNSLFDSQNNVPTYGSNYPGKSVPGRIDSHDSSQASSPGFGFNQGPLTKPDNSNHGSQGSFPGLRSNQGPINGQDTYHNPQDFSRTSGSDMGYDRNFPLVWQLESTEVSDQDALKNNKKALTHYFNSINLWRLQPLEDNTYSLNLRRLPKVVLLKSKVLRDYSKPNGTVTINGNNMFYSSVRVVKDPSIDDVRAIYNPHSSEAPIYIKTDENWPILVGSNKGKMISIRHVRRVYF